MPHECTGCGLTFPDGSKQMLSGCPECGGNKFQFHPGNPSNNTQRSSSRSDASPPRSDTTTQAAGSETPPTSPNNSRNSFATGTPESEESDDAPDGTPERSPTDSEPSPPDPGDSESAGTAGDDLSHSTENRAQASARSTLTSGDEFATSDTRRDRSAPTGQDVSSEVADPGNTDNPPEPSGDTDPPDISKLREELNEQFESIKIHARGEYELNLMELYDREEHIIALEEDGRYVIDVPSSWRDPDGNG